MPMLSSTHGIEPWVHCEASAEAALEEAAPTGAGGGGGGGRAARALVLSKSSSWWCVCAPGESWWRSPTGGTVTGPSGA